VAVDTLIELNQVSDLYAHCARSRHVTTYKKLNNIKIWVCNST